MRFERILMALGLLLVAVGVGALVLRSLVDDAPQIAGESTPETTSPTSPDEGTSTPSVTVEVLGAEQVRDLWVSPSGSDGARGDAAEPMRTVEAAAARLPDGGTIHLLAGTHPAFKLENVNGGDGLTIRAAAGAEGSVTVSDGDYNRTAAVWLQNSSDITVQGLKLRTSLWAVEIRGSQRIRIIGNDIDDIGQEAVHPRFGSSDIEIAYNRITGTGNRPGYTLGGSGVYVGSSDGQDATHDVHIHHNEIFGTASEGIDVKGGTWGVTIEDNEIHDIATLQTGAVVLHLNFLPPAFDPELVVRRNRIWNISTGTQWADGNAIVVGAAATVVNNVAWNNQHRALLVEDDFVEGNPTSVLIAHNTFFNNGRTDVEIRSSRADVSFLANFSRSPTGQAWDGQGNVAPQSSDFVNAGVGDFSLVATSSGIDTAPVVATVVRDFFGNTRSGAGPDVGAFELDQPDPEPEPETPPTTSGSTTSSTGGDGTGGTTAPQNSSTTTVASSSTTSGETRAETTTVPRLSSTSTTEAAASPLGATSSGPEAFGGSEGSGAALEGIDGLADDSSTTASTGDAASPDDGLPADTVAGAQPENSASSATPASTDGNAAPEALALEAADDESPIRSLGPWVALVLGSGLLAFGAALHRSGRH